jgi:hypothetical protein
MEPTREQRLEIGGRRGHREDVVERYRTCPREFGACRDQRIEDKDQEVTPLSERPPGHARLRMIPSAM